MGSFSLCHLYRKLVSPTGFPAENLIEEIERWDNTLKAAKNPINLANFDDLTTEIKLAS